MLIDHLRSRCLDTDGTKVELALRLQMVVQQLVNVSYNPSFIRIQSECGPSNMPPIVMPDESCTVALQSRHLIIPTRSLYDCQFGANISFVMIHCFVHVCIVTNDADSNSSHIQTNGIS
jgi:hypothetical protein